MLPDATGCPVPAGAAVSAGAFGLATLPAGGAASGSMFEVIESGPNRCTTMPDGGGSGIGFANAVPAGSKKTAKKAVKTLIFKDYLQTLP
jgi:hypothetical protein